MSVATALQVPLLPGAWRGLGGRTPTLQSVQFDQQLDKLALWIEDWSHEQRCQILEALLTQSNYTQFRFLWTVMQPALHRDFMYTAKKEFPTNKFTPISTYTTREIKERLIRNRQDNFFRIKSAYLQHVTQVKEVAGEHRLPRLTSPKDTDQARKTQNGYAQPVKATHFPKVTKTSLAPNHKPKEIQAVLFDGDHTSSSWHLLANSPSVRFPSIDLQRNKVTPELYKYYATFFTSRFIEMPVRRHIQDEMSPRGNAVPTLEELNIPDLANSEKSSSVSAEKKLKEKKAKKRNQHAVVKETEVPSEGLMLIHWYTQIWDDVQRNEFLHKLLLKLDPRQHYFISSYLSVQQHRDFLALLPAPLALKILSYLSAIQLLNSSRVSKTWYGLCNNNELWKLKCQEVHLRIPVGNRPNWKKVFRENKYIKLNWNMGRCRIVDCRGHTDRVLSVTFDRKRMATGSLDKTIKIWELKDGKLLQTLKGHQKGVWCLRFFTKHLLISGSYDSSIKVWNLREGTCARTLVGHDGPVWAIVRHNNMLVSASQDKTAKVWEISRCMLVQTLKGHNAAVFAVDMDEEGSIVVTGSADRSVRLWDAVTGKIRKVIWASQTTSIMSVSYSKGFVACSFGEIINLYKVDGAKLIRTYEEHQKRIECLELKINNAAKAEGTIVSAGKDSVVKYWDITKEKSVQTFTGHHRQINCIHFDETRIVSASYDNKLKIWDFNI